MDREDLGPFGTTANTSANCKDLLKDAFAVITQITQVKNNHHKHNGKEQNLEV